MIWRYAAEETMEHDDGIQEKIEDLYQCSAELQYIF